MNKRKIIKTIIVTREALLPFLLLQNHLRLEFQKRTHIFRKTIWKETKEKESARKPLQSKKRAQCYPLSNKPF